MTVLVLLVLYLPVSIALGAIVHKGIPSGSFLLAAPTLPDCYEAVVQLTVLIENGLAPDPLPVVLAGL